MYLFSLFMCDGYVIEQVSARLNRCLSINLQVLKPVLNAAHCVVGRNTLPTLIRRRCWNTSKGDSANIVIFFKSQR